MGVVLEGDFKGTIYTMEKEFPKIERQAVYAGARILRDAAKRQMLIDFPKAASKNSNYVDTISDAVMMSKMDGTGVTVHVLGHRGKGSQTYKARFFEKGTKDRYAKSWKGKRLKKKRYMDRIKDLRFFRKAVTSNQQKALDKIKEVFEDRLSEIFNK